jgi:hypothetical protein
VDVDRPLGLVEPRRLEVLVREVDPFPLRDLEGFHDLVVGHGLVVLGLADLLVADAAAVGLVHVMEVQAVLLHGTLHAHGDADEPEGDRAGPDRSHFQILHVLRQAQTTAGAHELEGSRA